MMNGRRGFFKKIGLGLAATVIGANLQASDIEIEVKGDFYVKKPFTNPRFMSTLDYNDVFKDAVLKKHEKGFTIEGPNIYVSVYNGSKQYRSITARTPVSMQTLYSAFKNEWKENPELIKYDFPFTAITPEQFQVQSGWKLDKDNIRGGGFAIIDDDYKVIEEYAAVYVLSQEGYVFDERSIKCPNAGLVQVHDGKLQGSYQYAPDDKVIDLMTHIKNIGVDEATYMSYRIV